jgi:UDP-N-acetyl-D-glucosamine dehydrogenase
MDTDVVVVGLGYAGLPMVVAAARAGLRVVGVDRSESRIEEIVAGERGFGRVTVSEHEFSALLAGPLRLRTGPVPQAHVHLLCVPSRDLLNAVDMVADSVRHGDLVIVQSTCPPGMMDDVVIPRFKCRTDARIHLVYSPVRVDPGRERAAVVPRVIAGATPDCLSAGMRFLREIGEQVVPIGSIRAAELTKVFENTFRLVNISLANELAALCGVSDVDVTEVLDAVSTKPYGFLRHDPGPGAGGDCVPVCAEFFVAAARRRGIPAGTVEAAVAVNDRMPRDIVRSLAPHGRRVLVAGVSYKPGVGDLRRSAAVRILEELRTETEVGYHDPLVPSLRLSDGTELRSLPIEPGVADLVLLVTKHPGMDVRGFEATIVDCSTGLPSFVEGRDV